MKRAYVVAVGVANVHRDPNSSSELVTQALLNVPAISEAESGEWIYVSLVDYDGWMLARDVAEPIVKGFCKVGEHCATPLDLMAVVARTYTPLYSFCEGKETLDTAYLSTALPLIDTTNAHRLQVVLPGERIAWVGRDVVNIQRKDMLYPRTSVGTITTYARSFLGVPYLWGGTSWQGIDCSGFVQLCYRMGGYNIPRDADQQHDALTQRVPRDEMREGDLIFFGSKAITHVALALNHNEYIHSAGQPYNRVVISSFDPADPHYDQHLTEIVWDIKRVIL